MKFNSIMKATDDFLFSDIFTYQIANSGVE